jgi:hypothetical protein
MFVGWRAAAVEDRRERLAGLVLAGGIALVAMAVNTEACSSDSPNTPLGNGRAGHGGAGDVGRGGAGGSIGGRGGTDRGGTGGMAVAGAGGMGGAGGQTGCQLPAGAPGTWVEIATPPGQAKFHVTDAFAVGLNDLFFAGTIGDPNTGAGLTEARILRWTQGCWTVELSIPRGTGPIDSPSVHGLGTDDVWAAASDALYHRDAQGWTRFADEGWRTQIRQPPSFSSPPQFFRVRAAAPNFIWAAVTSNVVRWDGRAWTAYNFDDPNYPNESASIGFFFRSIWIDSPTNVWVGGASDQVGNTMDLSFMHHFDGTSWTHTAITLGEVEEIWRGGSVLWLANPAPMFTIQRFDGTRSMDEPILGVDPQNRPALTSLFGRGTTDLWAAGDDVAHFDGQTWSLDPGVPAAARSVLDERNSYVTGDAGSVWLATPGPRFFRMVTGP